METTFNNKNILKRVKHLKMNEYFLLAKYLENPSVVFD